MAKEAPNPMSNDLRLKTLRRAAPNSWIALSEDESSVIATGNSYAEVVDAAAAAGCDDPVVLKTPERWLPLTV